MIKQEMYDALKAAGHKLKAINFCKLEDLEALYKQQFPDNHDQNQQNNNQDGNQDCNTGNSEVKNNSGQDCNQDGADDTDNKESPPEKKVEPIKIRRLYFDHSGWCQELKRSYFRGYHMPQDGTEYTALRKYAAREV